MTVVIVMMMVVRQIKVFARALSCFVYFATFCGILQAKVSDINAVHLASDFSKPGSLTANELLHFRNYMLPYL